MTQYVLTLKAAGEPDDAKSTEDLDDALDWFTNAATEVMAEDAAYDSASLTADGVEVGWIENPDSGEDTGERAPRPTLRAVRGGRA